MTAEELKKYVTSNKRICPMPIAWNKFLDILEIKEKMPPHLIPLILNGWFSSDLEKRKRISFSQKEKEFQKYRRGRYAEFNLIYDRGTHFGLQSRGRTESILMSMPPTASWVYNYEPKKDSAEAKLQTVLKHPQQWVN